MDLAIMRSVEACWSPHNAETGESPYASGFDEEVRNIKSSNPTRSHPKTCMLRSLWHYRFRMLT
eukprot:2008590-Karenia_brevis.AAC.1